MGLYTSMSYDKLNTAELCLENSKMICKTHFKNSDSDDCD